VARGEVSTSAGTGGGESADRSLRRLVAGSWRRCVAAGTPPEAAAPVLLDDVALAERRAQHPLARLMPVLDELLGMPAREAGDVFAVADADGTLLWVSGAAKTLARAERMHFVPGAAWSEDRAGTNAPGTSLVERRAVRILGAEHYNAAVRDWSCAAVPVRDPASGLAVGVLDVTGGPEVADPYALALVRAAARVATAELGRTDGAAPVPLFTALGRDHAVLRIAGTVQVLSPRYSEILAVLALAAGGVTGGRLAVELSSAELRPVTIRAELSRLRAMLGDDLLGSRPYALRRPVAADFLVIRDLIARGRVAEALAGYTGPLLPSSEAPAVVAYRDALHQQLRGAVLASGAPGQLRRWVDAPWGADDADAWLALAHALPGGSAPRAAAAARSRALSVELTATTFRQRPGA